ncbi:MAG TPA: NAD(P)H-hydrate dehydratase [Solirubrobacterales bacterium]|nr:NAD(P)H-hydrate dehydratase [Solirubrobacterales bacterium]
MGGWLDPVFDAEGMGRADRWAIEQSGIPSLDLMEAAGRGLADAAASLAGHGPIRVVCGKGNNGGDGLVAARHLAAAGFQTEVLLLWPVDRFSPDSRTNFDRLRGVEVYEGAAGLSRLPGSGLIVDAMLGTGFEGTPREPVSGAIDAVNAAGSPVVCCDVPSGLDASTGEADQAVNGSLTITFHGLKIGHLISPGKQLCGPVEVIDIGIPKGAPSGDAAGRINSSVLELLPRRGAASNKFTSGRVSIVGGSRGLTGAVCLAAEAAIRAGAGYATAAVPFDLEPIFEVKLTEVMSIGCGDTEGYLGRTAREEILEHCDESASVVLGSGMGRRKDTGKLIRSLTTRLKGPLVLDADGLGGLDGKLERVKARSGATILTPHAGEMGRLIGLTASEVTAHRLRSALTLARGTGGIAVLKGDDTIVTDGERVAINDLPSPALATAGTGDMLAGITAGFVARGVEPFAAACAAVHCGCRAGRIAAERAGSAEGVIATDAIAALPAAMRVANANDRVLE